MLYKVILVLLSCPGIKYGLKIYLHGFNVFEALSNNDYSKASWMSQKGLPMKLYKVNAQL